MDMLSNQNLLTSVLHTVQMGQIGIRSVMGGAIRPGLKQELQDQLSEYDAMETEAQRLAAANSWVLDDLNPAIRTMSNVMSRVQLMGGERDSKIAGMLIQGNTRGSILGLKNLHKAEKADQEVKALAQRLLNRETINIQKAQEFL